MCFSGVEYYCKRALFRIPTQLFRFATLFKATSNIWNASNKDNTRQETICVKQCLILSFEEDFLILSQREFMEHYTPVIWAVVQKGRA